ncbi:tetratricopeptide repeat protein, partial [Nanoarchaeota archaeon]
LYEIVLKSPINYLNKENMHEPNTLRYEDFFKIELNFYDYINKNKTIFKEVVRQLLDENSENGDPDKIVKYLDILIENDPTAALYYQRAKNIHDIDSNKMIPDLENALKLNEFHIESNLLLGDLYLLNQNNFKKSIPYYNNAYLQLQKEDNPILIKRLFPYFFKLSEEHIKSGKLKKAAKCYGEILKLDNKNYKAAVRLIDISRELGNNNFKLLDEINVNDLDLEDTILYHFNKGVMHYGLDELDESVSNLNNVLDLIKSNLNNQITMSKYKIKTNEVLINLSDKYYTFMKDKIYNNADEKRSTIKNILELNPKHYDTLVDLADFEIAHKQYNTALIALTESIAIKPAFDLYMKKGDINFGTNNLKTALSDFKFAQKYAENEAQENEASLKYKMVDTRFKSLNSKVKSPRKRPVKKAAVKKPVKKKAVATKKTSGKKTSSQRRRGSAPTTNRAPAKKPVKPIEKIREEYPGTSPHPKKYTNTQTTCNGEQITLSKADQELHLKLKGKYPGYDPSLYASYVVIKKENPDYSFEDYVKDLTPSYPKPIVKILDSNGVLKDPEENRKKQEGRNKQTRAPPPGSKDGQMQIHTESLDQDNAVDPYAAFLGPQKNNPASGQTANVDLASQNFAIQSGLYDTKPDDKAVLPSDNIKLGVVWEDLNKKDKIEATHNPGSNPEGYRLVDDSNKTQDMSGRFSAILYSQYEEYRKTHLNVTYPQYLDMISKDNK